MVQTLTRETIAEKALIHSHPVLRNAPVDRCFELPPVPYAAIVGLFLGFLGVMWLGFANPQLVLPMAIFVTFIVCGFGMPALWVRMQPKTRCRPRAGTALLPKESRPTPAAPAPRMRPCRC